MKKNPYLFRCYARPEKSYFIGICADLDIAVRGESIPQVKEEMTRAIKVYFSSLDKTNFKDLFPRPVPLFVLLDYYRVATIFNCFNFIDFFNKNFQTFREQLIPKEFSVSPCV